MSRRRTRKVNKTRTRQRRNSGAGRRVAAAAVSSLVALLVPMKQAILRAGGWAYQSRGVRRGAGVAAGLLVLAALGWVMLHNLKGSSRYALDPGRIELSAEPSWAKGSLADHLKSEIEQELRAELAELAMTSAFDEEVIPLIVNRMQENPWVRRVIRVERRFPTAPEGHSQLLPLVEIRRPVVVVETGKDYVLVDGDGAVLPLSIPADGAAFAEFRHQLTSPLRLVRGVVGKAPAPGTIWHSEQIAAALSMERVLRKAKLDHSLPIEAIDVSVVPERANERGKVFYMSGGVWLVADQRQLPGTSVIWGRPPVHANTLELSPNEKLDELRRHLNSGAPLHGKAIDLRRRGT